MSRIPLSAFAVVLVFLPAAAAASAGQSHSRPLPGAEFQTSDRCMVCHNGMKTGDGEDFSIGRDWRTSVMANAARDPYWQASVRRETVDHSESSAAIEDECAICHMPMARYTAKVHGQAGSVFALLGPDGGNAAARQALDGVSCSVCHQIGAENLGTAQSFNGGFVLNPPDARGARSIYGPFEIDKGLARIMRSSSAGYSPVQNEHIRDSALCATCHTLYTRPAGSAAKGTEALPEQMPYVEWLHSDYRTTKTCTGCHAPEVPQPAPITRVLGEPRQGVRRHVFVGANFFMQRLLNRFAAELDVPAPPADLDAAAARTERYLQTQALRLSIASAAVSGGRLRFEVLLDNLSGHKLPTAYPSRRLWLHVSVRDGGGRVVFESGALNADGSIRGNANDANPAAFEPHHDEITSSGQVQIYESILGDTGGKVTTGLLSAVRYLKDNRLLPHGFDKSSASRDIAVIGKAAADANFTGAGDRVTYSIPWSEPHPALRIEVEALYEPIGYRWAANLKQYGGAEPRRFGRYYDAMASGSAVRLAHATKDVAIEEELIQ